MKTRAGSIAIPLTCPIGIERFSSFKKLVRTTARVLSVFRRNPTASLRNIDTEITSTSYEAAIDYWIKECQNLLDEERIKEAFATLCPRKRDDGIWVVGSRIDKWVEITANHEEPILLPYNHRFTLLYAKFIHSISHSGVATTMAKID